MLMEIDRLIRDLEGDKIPEGDSSKQVDNVVDRLKDTLEKSRKM